ADADDEWKPPEKAPFVDLKRPAAPGCARTAVNDQFGVLHTAGSVAPIYWHWPGDPQPVDSATRNNWTESRLHWSPLGYLVTFSPSMFEVDTGKMERSFLHEQAAKWPVFKWSHKRANSLCPECKRAKRCRDVQDLSWSPTDNYPGLLWIGRNGQARQPARVYSKTMPEKRRGGYLRCCLMWPIAECTGIPQGNYLCVRVNRYTKKKLDADNTPKYINIYTNFESRTPSPASTGRPHGSKFAMVQGIASKGLSVVFYQVNAHDIEKVKVLEKRNVNTDQLVAYWSTSGATDIEWDPTGRYVVTTVSFWHVKVDNASHVYSSHGTLLYKLNKLESESLSVRLATEAANSANIKKNMKTYSRSTVRERGSAVLPLAPAKELLEKRARLKTELREMGVDTDELDSNAQDFRRGDAGIPHQGGTHSH
uniref:EIF2A domain-containing protein n=1 Tax=Macrostomum lignano TaxID=282301 RepID=A0A1I8F5R1_9PLAT